MQFVPWYPLSEAGQWAPASPGVFQVRVREGLLDYPRGKSAMVYYGAGDDVRAEAEALAAAYPDRDWLCRHAVDMTAWERENPRLACELYLERFRARFGSPPMIPERERPGS